MNTNEENSVPSAGKNYILSIRLIRSFEYRNIRHIPLRNLPATNEITGQQLKDKIRSALMHENLPPPFKTFAFDTLKIEHYPYQAKTNDLVLNRENDENLIIEDEKLLSDYQIVDGTEIAFFKRSDYESYKKNPSLNIGEFDDGKF